MNKTHLRLIHTHIWDEWNTFEIDSHIWWMTQWIKWHSDITASLTYTLFLYSPHVSPLSSYCHPFPAGVSTFSMAFSSMSAVLRFSLSCCSISLCSSIPWWNFWSTEAFTCHAMAISLISFLLKLACPWCLCCSAHCFTPVSSLCVNIWDWFTYIDTCESSSHSWIKHIWDSWLTHLRIIHTLMNVKHEHQGIKHIWVMNKTHLRVIHTHNE